MGGIDLDLEEGKCHMPDQMKSISMVHSMKGLQLLFKINHQPGT